MIPVFFLFVYFGKADMGFTVGLVLGITMIAIYLRWKLRKHVWFWATIVFVLLLHIPLFFLVRWPDTNVPTIANSMPLGITDFLLISGAISLAQKLFSEGSSSEDDEE
jgi:multisubunit Na+/H+ antiporter MnhB subunit